MALTFSGRSSSPVVVTVRVRSWRGGSNSERRRSCSSRSPSLVMARPRQPREARVQHGPDQAQAGGLAGEPADDLGAAAGLAEGPLDEVGMPDAVVVLRGEPQVGGQALAVGEQAFHRRRVGRGVLGGHLGDPVTGQLDEPGAGLGLQAITIVASKPMPAGLTPGGSTARTGQRTPGHPAARPPAPAPPGAAAAPTAAAPPHGNTGPFIARNTVGAIVKTCGSRSLSGFRLGVLAGPFDELAVDEGRSSADQGNEVGAVDGSPAVLC